MMFRVELPLPTDVIPELQLKPRAVSKVHRGGLYKVVQQLPHPALIQVPNKMWNKVGVAILPLLRIVKKLQRQAAMFRVAREHHKHVILILSSRTIAVPIQMRNLRAMYTGKMHHVSLHSQQELTHSREHAFNRTVHLHIPNQGRARSIQRQNTAICGTAAHIASHNKGQDQILTAGIMGRSEKVHLNGPQLNQLQKVSRTDLLIQHQAVRTTIVTQRLLVQAAVQAITLHDQVQEAVRAHRQGLHVLLQVHPDRVMEEDNIQFQSDH